MKIFYSPYFLGHTYIDYAARPQGGLLGESAENTTSLLNRLELLYGLTSRDIEDEDRLEPYYAALEAGLPQYCPLRQSLINDAGINDPNRHLRVTAELLRWRDSLLMAGWDPEKDLPAPLLSGIAGVEKGLDKCSLARKGKADRWRVLLACGKTVAGLQIEVCCPRILVPGLVTQVLEHVAEKVDYAGEYPEEEIRRDHIRIISFEEQTEAYEWLAGNEPAAGQLVVCQDGLGLDSVLRRYGRPTAAGTSQKGSHYVVEDIRCMLDTPSSLVWMDCCGDYGFRDPYGFIDKETRKTLGFLPAEEEMLEAVRRHLVHVLNSVPEEVTLISGRYLHGKAQPLHPVIAALTCGAVKEERLSMEHGSIDTPLSAPAAVERFAASAEYDLGESAVVGTPVMSYSALDRLIQFPFSFVVERIAGLWDPSKDTDLSTEKGIVAHRVVELLAEKGALQICRYQEVLEAALDECGKLLCLPENRFEMETFSHDLEMSVTALSEIIDGNGLEIVGCELSIPERKEGEKKAAVEMDVFGPSTAFLDMVLKDQDGEYYLFDFKYSYSESRYQGKLEQNKSVQMTFYKEIFDRFYAKGKRIRAYGYYLFPKNTLYVPEGELGSSYLGGDHVQVVPLEEGAISDSLEALRNSFGLRMEQLKKGVIEEGEGMKLEGLSYYMSQQEGAALMPLDSMYNHKDLKSASYAPEHVVLKNQIR